MSYKIFQIDTSIRPTSDSYSRRSGQYFIRKFQEKFGQLEVSYLDLNREAPSSHFLDSMCSSNIWLWCLSAEISAIPASLATWMNFVSHKKFSLNQSCQVKLFSQKLVVIANLQKETDTLSPKFNVEPQIRRDIKICGIDDVDFFYMFQKDNNMQGEIKLQKDINKYIAGLHL